MKDDNEFRKCVHLGWNWVHLRSPGSEFAFGRSQYLISSFPFTWVLHFPTLEWQFPFTWVEYSRISEGINSRRFLRSHHSTSSTLLDVSSPSPIFPAPFYLFPPFWFNFFFWTLFDFSLNFFFLEHSNFILLLIFPSLLVSFGGYLCKWSLFPLALANKWLF